MSWLQRVRQIGGRRHEFDWRFALGATAVFAVVLAVGHLHHEMWRDELHCWAVGRGLTGLGDALVGERRYDGHPFLWYYLLHLVSHLSRSYLALKVVTASLAVAAAALWLRHAPLPRALRVMLLGGYYLLFEYGIMCRSYTLGVALTFGFCALYHPSRIRHVALAVILALLATTSLYGMMVAVALGFFLFVQGPRVHGPDVIDGRQRLALPTDWLLGLLIFVAGIALTLITTWPQPDAFFRAAPLQEVTAAVIRRGLADHWKGMFPFTGLGNWYWPRGDYLFSKSPTGLAAAPWLGAAWLASCLFALRKSPRIAATYALGALLIATAQHTVYAGGWRHLGHYFILLVACAWLHARQSRGRQRDRLLHTLLAVNLAAQLITGWTAFRTDYQRVFSRATEAALFIRDHHLADRPIVAAADHGGLTTASVLDRPLFFPATGETAETVVYHNRRVTPTPAQLWEHARRLATTGGGSALVIAEYDLDQTAAAGLTIKLLYRGGPAIMSDESFIIYGVEIR